MREVNGSFIGKALGAIALLALGVVCFNSIWFYNEAGYQTHIRTFFGEEKVVTDIGYSTKWFGRATPWKQAMTVQFTMPRMQQITTQEGQVIMVPIKGGDDNVRSDESTGSVESYRVVFLGNVDGGVEASTRFRLPAGEQFLRIAREYRTPENFVATALIPAIKETLQATASLMSADDYFAGARSEFANEFENQLRNGQYVTKRKEIQRSSGRGRNEAPGLHAGGDIPGLEEEGRRTEFVTEKVLDKDGNPVRKNQQFIQLGVDVVEARITNIDPNDRYKQRMVRVQEALAELAVARQGRLKEEEEKLLVTARGEKEVEQKRQETLREQIEKTTRAETEKQLAVINAEREKKRAEIEKETAEISLEKTKIEAQATKATADAEAYAKEALIKANGNMEQKLQTLREINKYWAEASAMAKVPGVMMAGANGEGVSRQGEMQQMMQLLTVKAAKDLQVDLSVK
jgi:regulator of protease activity HflC (stomatin/prohibitin superfamily)